MELTLQQIEEALTTLPARIAKKAVEAEEAWEMWQKFEVSYEADRARSYLRHKAMNEKATVAELQALVSSDEVVMMSRVECIRLEAIYRRRMVEVKELDNKFTGVKKLITLRESEMRTIG